MITIIALVAIGGYILIYAALYTQQERLIFHPEVLAADFTFTFPWRFEEIALPSDGAVISALYFKADHPKGVVLYFHGNNWNERGVLLERLPMVSRDAARLHITDDNCREKDI